jgi:hypothetical protein|tara:strand:+ start:1659 stop:1811 length:153 start_codon:yes stop_codon:yes gene_type:complete
MLYFTRKTATHHVVFDPVNNHQRKELPPAMQDQTLTRTKICRQNHNLPSG